MQKVSTNMVPGELEGPDFPKGPEFYEFLRRYLTTDCDYPSDGVKDFVDRVGHRWDKAQNEYYDWGYWVNSFAELMEKVLEELAADDPQADCRELILQNPEGLALAALTKYQEFGSPQGTRKRISPGFILQTAKENKAPRPLYPWQWPLAIQADVYYNCCCNGRNAKSAVFNPCALNRLKESLKAAGVDTDLLARIARVFGMVYYTDGYDLLDIARCTGRAACGSIRAV